MKQLLGLLFLGIATSALGIEFITEADVAKTLKADKVIEVSKYKVEGLIDGPRKCQDGVDSRSGRAYVVKLKDKAALYVTPSGLRDLTECGDLN